MEPVEAIFSGGPVNGKHIALPCAYLDYYFAVEPGLNFLANGGEYPDKYDRPRKATYRRTTSIDKNLNIIYEFCGIE